MKSLIINEQLSLAAELLEKQLPLSIPFTNSVNISEIRPVDLDGFMAAHGIPSTAVFSSINDDTLLEWTTSQPPDEAFLVAFRHSRFPHIVFKLIYDQMAKNGYKRVPFNSRLLQEYKGIDVYSLYLSGNTGRLIEYYSIYFSDIQDI
jgi:hypothetical protein